MGMPTFPLPPSHRLECEYGGESPQSILVRTTTYRYQGNKVGGFWAPNITEPPDKPWAA